ncbi:hypothetical protein HMN09_00493700 [Mycena chlorophos]|uniref:DUF7730 domain-containing protein n=1 Tax=Mycena chlorophos TaxID=658473 RepID=A0A8H6T9G5_MYCCL|nr:hypothetical protein HMN09_00493700 [Mycena chlorophos]
MSRSSLRRALNGLQFALALICCWPYICFIAYGLNKAGSHPGSTPIVYPPPLPTKRIDISKTPPATPSDHCHILNLPLEVRLIILEDLLGGRIIRLRPLLAKPRQIGCMTACEMHSACVFHHDVAVIKTCRQLYLEGLPILHRKNTYYFDISDFPQLFLGGLGMYCISNIRHLCLELDVEPDSLERAVELLHEMRLETLHIRLRHIEGVVKFMTLDGDLATRILAIRGLRAFEVEFLKDDPRETEQRQLATQLVADYQALMVGPQAQEKYLAFLKDRAEHGTVVA